jgi:hypothetical protein
MIFRSTIFTSLFAALAMTGFATAANATPLTYDLTLTPAVGTLTGTGTFTIDATGTPTGVYTVASGTLLNLSFTIGGHIFDLSNAISGPSSTWVYFAGGAFNGVTYTGIDGDILVSLNVGALSYTYSNQTANAAYSIGTVSGQPAPVQPVPEPLTLALLGAGLAGMGAMRGRRKAA